MRRYGVYKSLAMSTTANTLTYPICLLPGTTRNPSVYEVIWGANMAVPVDAIVLLQVTGSSTTLTAGTSITPQPLNLGDTAAITGASFTPTGFTVNAQPYLSYPINARSTIRWVAVEPDARIEISSGTAAANNILVTNQQPGTATITMDNQLFFIE